MALSRRLGVVAILSSCFFVAVACGDDDSKQPNGGDAGAGGEAEGGDGNGSGGSKNTAGKGGMSTAGTAGQATAGTAGSGGTAGTGGNISEAGSGGGGDEPMGGTGPGVGGEGGGVSGGAGGEGGAPVVVRELKACSYDCLVDNDCAIPRPDNPPDTTYKCNVDTKKCENPDAVCETNANCVPQGSFFFGNCQSDAECFEGEACVSWEGVGWCAALPGAENVCFFGGTPEPLPHLGAQGTIDVCVSHTWVCGEQKGKIECFPGCEESGCGEGKGDTCNPQTGLCECETSAECGDDKACNDGHCAECATDDHCAPAAGATGHDICVNGKCGCSGANKCPNPGFTGATKACE